MTDADTTKYILVKNNKYMLEVIQKLRWQDEVLR